MLKRFILFLVLATALFGGELRVGTLNCLLLFNPDLAHQGKVSLQNPLSAEGYREKITNLASLIKDCDFVGLQELGGREELEDLAKATGWDWALTKGTDTYTGEEVGALYHLPGWKVTRNGRVADLDSSLSHHLLLTASKGGKTLRFLIVHLIRPLGQNRLKHEKQIAAVQAWATKLHQEEPQTSLIILGDTNDTAKPLGTSLFGLGQEAGELIGYPATHLDGRSYDRLILIGPGAWTAATITRPPYGKRPNASLKRVWTDHFVFKASLQP